MSVLRRTALTALGLLLACVSARAQVRLPLAQEDTSGVAGMAIPGSHLLVAQEAAARAYLKAHPEALQHRVLRKTTSYALGESHSWYAHDFTIGSEYRTSSTCRALGSHCYVFVEDSLWISGRVTQGAVDSVRAAFDERTPGDPARGVYQSTVDAFGSPPDVDGDPRIVILILNIRDGWSGSGGYIAGYFYSINEFAGYPGGNSTEIYYLDANPLDLRSPGGLRVGMSTTAHEFQHMIHWRYDPSEIAFINEGCSLVAEVNCGYPIYGQSGYASETNHYLFDWRGSDYTAVLRDYSRAARFMTYYRDQFGMGVFRPVVASTLTGIGGMNAGLAAYGTARRFSDLLVDWLVANILDDRSVDPRYGYLYQPALQKASTIPMGSPNASASNEVIQSMGATYLAFKGLSELHVTFTSLNSALAIRAVETGAARRVVTVTPGVEFSEPLLGSTYSDITFVLINTDPSGPLSYSFTSTGSSGVAGPVELRWDRTEPTGYLPLSPLDTVAVTFDGVAGAHLDSVRVALRRAGSITGGVWSAAATGNSLLGAPLAVPLTAQTSSTPGFPYPVPWPNWGILDLRSFHIDASRPFAVGFVYAGSDATDPRVMVTEQVGTSSYHSFAFLHGASPAGWYFLSGSDTTVYLFMIRAYVSMGTTGVAAGRELTPRAWSLGQNYPNPFNPSTTIEYTVARRGHVLLTVFDLLGREVTRLIDGELAAGVHRVTWDPAGLPSGAYFYRLQAEGVTQTRKLMLMK